MYYIISFLFFSSPRFAPFAKFHHLIVGLRCAVKNTINPCSLHAVQLRVMGVPRIAINYFLGHGLVDVIAVLVLFTNSAGTNRPPAFENLTVALQSTVSLSLPLEFRELVCQIYHGLSLF